MSRTGVIAAELCIKIFVFSLIAYAFYFTTVDVATQWLINYHSKKLLGGAYLATLLFLYPLLATTYISLTFGRRTHNIPRYPLPDTHTLTEPYECTNANGDLATCAKCNGAWKPPRTHHCSTCGVCRMEFDHHCPWVGNCVTKTRMNSFLALLLLTPLLFLFSLLPISSPLLRHIPLALKTSQHDPWAQRVWWSWPGSYIFLGGPPGRWVLGLALGFRILKATERDPGIPVMGQPNLRSFVVCALGGVFSLFTLTLAVWILKDLARGLTTLDTLQMQGRRQKHPPRFVCIPASKHVAAVLDDERLYDLGLRTNLVNALSGGPRSCITSGGYAWPKVNPHVLERIQKQKMRGLVQQGGDSE